MHEAGQKVVQSNCIRCHENQLVNGRLDRDVPDYCKNITDRKCWECHREVPHGRVHSLSAVKYYGKIEEEHQETVAEWMKNLFTK
jgi:cytochrome c nitrite reductase small subunit